MINILLIFILGLGLFFNYKKTLFFVACFFPILNMFRGLGPVSLTNVLGLMAMIIAAIRFWREVKQCPIFYATLLYIIICTISNYINEVHTPSMLANVSTTVLLPIVLWRFVKTDHEVKLFLKIWTIYFLIICLYGYYEAATNSNPFAEWACDEKNKLFGGYYGRYSNEIRFGYKRIQSLMLWRDACGALSASFWGLLYFIRTYRREYIDTNWMRFATTALMFMLPVIVLLTGTRACIAILIVCVVGTIKRFSMKSLIVVCFVGAIVDSIAEPYLNQIFLSFFETDKVAGSSLDMRQMQMEAVLSTLKQAPLLGNGFADWHDYSKWADELLGAESMWFHLLLKVGILGTLSFVCIMILLARHLIQLNIPYALILLVAYIIGLTLSSLPGYNMPILFIIISVLMKTYGKRINSI